MNQITRRAVRRLIIYETKNIKKKKKKKRRHIFVTRYYLRGTYYWYGNFIRYQKGRYSQHAHPTIADTVFLNFFFQNKFEILLNPVYSFT